MMLPHFLRNHFPFLDRCYITILDIGGSHAHRLRPLVDALGIVTLVITDLDAGLKKSAVPVKRKAKQETNNPTLRNWAKAQEVGHDVDTLLDLDDEKKSQQIDDLFGIRIAYQTPIAVRLPSNEIEAEALPNTFEDSLVLSNVQHFAKKKGQGLSKAFAAALRQSQIADDLGKALFDALRDGDKAKFALQVLGDPDFAKLTVPEYIREGLFWLETKLKKKSKELLIVPTASIEVTEG
jgi:hypothetical protein